MANKSGGKDRVAPIIVMDVRCAARHLPACQCCAGLGLCAMAQEQKRDAAFSGGERKPPAGDQVQTFGHAFNFQQHRAYMRTGQDVVGCAQRIGGIPGPHLDQLPWIAAQFEQPIGGQRAIFHRLVIGSDPEE